MSTDEERKEKLERLLQEGEKKGQEIAKKSSDFARFANQMSDVANAGQEVLKYIKANQFDWEPKINAWEFLNQQEDGILQSMDSISIPIASTSGTESAYTMADFARPDTIINFVEPDKKDKARVASQRLSSVIDRPTEKSHVLSLILQNVLSSAPVGQKSPKELFETAWAAFEKPVLQGSPASTSLIPMRECIKATVATLLRRRRKQEQVKRNEKILSIGKQIAYSGIPQSIIQSLQSHYNLITDELSGAKQKSYSREAWGDILRRATLFLRELLEAIDQSKMR